MKDAFVLFPFGDLKTDFTNRESDALFEEYKRIIRNKSNFCPYHLTHPVPVDPSILRCFDNHQSHVVMLECAACELAHVFHNLVLNFQC